MLDALSGQELEDPEVWILLTVVNKAPSVCDCARVNSKARQNTEQYETQLILS